MSKRILHSVAVCGLVLVCGPALAIDSDPCSDIDCVGDDCLTCWEEGDHIECAEVPRMELELICDVDLVPLGLGFTGPAGPGPLPPAQTMREIPLPQPDPERVPARTDATFPLPN